MHSPDAIRHDTIRYAGSLLKYSFSEVNHRKSVSIIEMDENGSYEMTERFLESPLDMREITGTIEELLDPTFYQSQKMDDYLKVTLLNEGALIDPINKLRQIYPNILHLERKIEQTDFKRKQSFFSSGHERKTALDLFSDFYSEMTTSEYSKSKEALIAEIIDLAKKEAL